MAINCNFFQTYDQITVDEDITNTQLFCVYDDGGEIPTYPQPAQLGSTITVPIERLHEFEASGEPVNFMHWYELRDIKTGAVKATSLKEGLQGTPKGRICLLFPDAGVYQEILINPQNNSLPTNVMIGTTNIYIDNIDPNVKTFQSLAGTTEIIEHGMTPISGSVEALSGIYADEQVRAAINVSPVCYIFSTSLENENHELIIQDGWTTITNYSVKRIGFEPDHRRKVNFQYESIDRPLQLTVRGAVTWDAIKNSGRTWNTLETHGV